MLAEQRDSTSDEKIRVLSKVEDSPKSAIKGLERYCATSDPAEQVFKNFPNNVRLKSETLSRDQRK